MCENFHQYSITVQDFSQCCLLSQREKWILCSSCLLFTTKNIKMIIQEGFDYINQKSVDIVKHLNPPKIDVNFDMN